MQLTICVVFHTGFEGKEGKNYGVLHRLFSEYTYCSVSDGECLESSSDVVVVNEISEMTENALSVLLIL